MGASPRSNAGLTLQKNMAHPKSNGMPKTRFHGYNSLMLSAYPKQETGTHMSLTDEQASLVEANFSGMESVSCVQAYAGTGKTHTLKEFAKKRSGQPILYLAFNKSMASEAQRKFEELLHVEAKTLHSLAYRFVGHKFRDRLGDIEIRDLLTTAKEAFPRADQYIGALAIKDWFNNWLSSAASTPRSFLRKALNDEALRCLDHGRIEPDRLIVEVENLWKIVQEGQPLEGKPCPFPHNAYLKMFQLMPPNLGYAYILVDEAQDITDCMIDIVMQQRAHKIFVGDGYQQIYAWNGAVNSLKKLEQEGARMFYLTRSFRCPEEVAALANPYLQLLGAPKPFVGCGEPRTTSTRAYLARTNAGIFEWGVKLLEETPNSRIHFLGGYTSYNFDVLADIASLLAGKRHQIKDKHITLFDSFDELAAYAEVGDMQLKARCNIVKVHGASVTPKLLNLKRRQTQENDADFTLSTGHKAKGAEWGSVSLGSDFIVIADVVAQAKNDEERVLVSREELHVLYVAITRSLGSLKMQKDYTLGPDLMREFQQLCSLGKIILAG